jgi:SAM-dependent methyltransferase
MRISKELIHCLRLVGKPRSILDVGCGTGDFVAYVSHMFSDCAVYGLDINRQSLANGIAKGNFDKAYPVHGDAQKLAKSESLFSLAYLKPEYRKLGFVEWEKLEERRAITLSDFDLVTAFNPDNRLSIAEVNTLIRGAPINRNLITVSIVSKAAKCDGFVIYQREIAHRLWGIFGLETPNELTKSNVDEQLKILLKEGQKDNLECLFNVVIKDEESANLIVLFQKPRE